MFWWDVVAVARPCQPALPAFWGRRPQTSARWSLLSIKPYVVKETSQVNAYSFTICMPQMLVQH
jgi:hypothetical protein